MAGAARTVAARLQVCRASPGIRGASINAAMVKGMCSPNLVVSVLKHTTMRQESSGGLLALLDLRVSAAVSAAEGRS